MKGEIISGPYRSNCLLEAWKAKRKNPNIKIFFCRPYRKRSGAIGSIHILWQDEEYSYDFSDEEWSDNGKFWQYFWYEGYIRRWPKNFAKRFSTYRNRINWK